jgi:hypothetical protein
MAADGRAACKAEEEQLDGADLSTAGQEPPPGGHM